jgi:hypothetical protein
MAGMSPVDEVVLGFPFDERPTPTRWRFETA